MSSIQCVIVDICNRTGTGVTAMTDDLKQTLLQLIHQNASTIDKLTKGLPSLIKRIESLERQIKYLRQEKDRKKKAK